MEKIVMSGKLESDCCNARPLFTISYAHGIRMAEDNKYYGVCGKCREHAEFNNQQTERESDETTN